MNNDCSHWPILLAGEPPAKETEAYRKHSAKALIVQHSLCKNQLTTCVWKANWVFRIWCHLTLLKGVNETFGEPEHENWVFNHSIKLGVQYHSKHFSMLTIKNLE